MSVRQDGRPVQILLVEDDQGDALLTTETLKRASSNHNLTWVRDGVEAMAFLRDKTLPAKSPKPDLILLDLNMPRKNGREVLEELKADPILKRIPVIVLSCSSAEEDIERCYELGASCYISKPVDAVEFFRAMSAFVDLWLNVAQLPPR